ncbi:hypothetical protein TL16_g01960 [Triparma laevis f. inornata]|uniref:EF-hand domain-containing protein n=1 Tax=Triparma laevis f. inornata TaxID=1714386 RepID=A0A9W7DVF5_9STRA|nr:hypothetical protein TL16_g01960 [Triparma laevis f. inornata]
MDADGDGTFEVEDMMAAMDKDGDGKLDESELQVFVDQLQQQMDFNNQLLGEMGKLEDAQLDAQANLKDKKKALVQALEVAESAKTEASEWRRKFEVANEVAKTNGEKLKEERVEMGGLKRELEEAEKAEEDQEKIIEAQKIKEEAATKEIEQLKAALEQEKSNALQALQDRDEKISTLENVNAGLVQEADELRLKNANLEGETEKLRAETLEDEEEISKMSDQLATEKAGFEECLAREKALEEELAKMEQALMNCESERDENASRAENNEREITDLEDELKEAQGGEREAEERVASLKRQLDKELLKIPKLEEELENSQAKNESYAKARVQTKLQNEKQLATAQEKNAKVVEEMRMLAQEHSLEIQKRSIELKELKSGYESKIDGLDSEMSGLHDLLSKNNLANQEMLALFANERATYDATIRGLNDTIGEKEDEIAHLNADNERVLESAASSIKDLKKEKLRNTRMSLTVVEQLQTQLKVVQVEHKKQKEDLNEMSSQFVTFATFVRGLEAKTAEPIEGWYQEVVRSFEMLVEQNSAVKAALEEVKDTQKKQNLGKLDEQAKTLQMEEEISRLEFDIQSAEDEKAQKDAEMAEMVKAQKDKLDAIKRESDEAKETMEQYKKKLATLEAMNGELQGKMSSNGEALAKAHSDAGEKTKQAEARCSELEQQIKKLQRDLAAMGEKADNHSKGKDEQEREMRRKQKEVEESEKTWAGKLDDEKKKLEAANKKIADSSKIQQKQKVQVDEMKKGWDREKKKNANFAEEIEQLKSELNGVQG